MTFFYSSTFSVFYMVFFHRGAKSVANIATGGQNPYFSTKSQYYHCSFCPGGGPNSIANFDGGAMAGFAPPGSATDQYQYKSWWLPITSTCSRQCRHSILGIYI